MLGFDITISRVEGTREVVLASYRERYGAGHGSRFDLIRHLLRERQLEMITGHGYPSTYLAEARHVLPLLTRDRLRSVPESEDDDLHLDQVAISATAPTDGITITAWDLS